MIVFVILLGFCIGSFLQAISDRFVNHKPIFAPRSFCFDCDKELKIRHIIPIISFCFLRGRCAFCKKPLSLMLIFSEITMGFCFVYAYFMSDNIYYFMYLSLFLSILFLLSLIDVKIQAVPSILLFAAFFLSAALAFDRNELISIIIFNEIKAGFLLYSSCFAGAIFLLKSLVSCLLNIKKQREYVESLGDADVIVIASIGGILGFAYGFLALFLACVLSLPFFIFLKLKGEKNPKVAMIPFLSLSFIIIFFLSKTYETYL